MGDPYVILAVIGKGLYGDIYRDFFRIMLCSSDIQ